MTERPSSGPRASTSRRDVLLATAGFAGLARPAVGAAAGIDDSGTTHRGSLWLDGTHEAVVGEDGTTVYLATFDGWAGVDVSDPSAPRLLASVEKPLGDVADPPLRAITDVNVSGDTLLVAGPSLPVDRERSFRGFATYDVSDPADPERLAYRETDDHTHNCFLDGDVAYLTHTTGPDGRPTATGIFDVSGDEPRRIGRFTPVEHGFDSPPHDVYVRDDVLYACHWDDGTWLVDVSDPSAPEALVRVGWDPSDVDRQGSVNELPGNSHYAQPSPDGSVLAVGKEAYDDEETAVRGGPGGVELWDVSDPSAPSREFVIAPPDTTDRLRTAHNLGWRGDRLYASWYAGGVSVYDVSDPGEPLLLGGWSDPGNTSFFACKPIHDGFVASSNEPRGDDGVLTFSEPSGEDATPAPAFDTFAGWTYHTYRGSTPTDARRDTSKATENPPDTTTRATDAGPASTPGGDGSPTPTRSPGLGPLVAAAAGGLVGWRLLRDAGE